jgi:hypothetical protein
MHGSLIPKERDYDEVQRSAVSTIADEVDSEDNERSRGGWSAMCSPDSRMRAETGGVRARLDLGTNTSTLHTFIADHYRSMDVCEHPEMVPLHGTLAGVNLQGGPLTPMFVLAKTRLHGDILGVPVEQVVDGIRHVPWEEKVEEKLLWRGRNTGSTYSKKTPWKATQRPRLVEVANAEYGELEILGPPAGMESKTVAEDRRRIPRAVANRHYFDIAFVDEPIRTSMRKMCPPTRGQLE